MSILGLDHSTEGESNEEAESMGQVQASGPIAKAIGIAVVAVCALLVMAAGRWVLGGLIDFLWTSPEEACAEASQELRDAQAYMMTASLEAEEAWKNLADAERAAVGARIVGAIGTLTGGELGGKARRAQARADSEVLMNSVSAGWREARVEGATTRLQEAQDRELKACSFRD